VVLADSPSWQKPELRIQGITKMSEVEGCVQEIVGILDPETVAVWISRRQVAGAASPPAAHGEVLAAEEHRRLPDSVESDQVVGVDAARIAVGENLPEPQVRVHVVRHPRRT